MQKKSIISMVIIAFAINLNAFALDLGEALKVMKESSKPKDLPNNQGIPDPALPYDKQNIKLTSDQYCEALTNSELANAFANTLSKAAKVDYSLANNAIMDSEDRIVTKWVKKKFHNLTFRDTYIPAEYANKCAYKLRDSNLLYLFGWPEKLREKFDQFDRENNTVKREVNNQGQIVNTKPTEYLPNFLGFHTTGEEQIRAEHAQVYVFAFPEGPEILKQYASESVAALETEMATYVATEAERKRNDQIAELKKQQEETQRLKNLEKQQKLNNTPDALLERSYAAYQIIDKCYEVRNGYALIYISDPEYLNAKKQIKQIEAKLKPKLTSSQDKLWTKASKVTQESEYSLLSYMSHDRGKQFCTSHRFELDGIANGLTGTTTTRKNF